MAVSSEYLTKIRRAVRVNSDPDIDAELTDIIEECRQDLISIGVQPGKANNESDSLILGAVRSFARWKFGLDEQSAVSNHNEYIDMRDEIRKKINYASETLWDI